MHAALAFYFPLHANIMTADACFKIGYIMKPHGLKGGVTIALDPEAPGDFGDIQTVFLETRERLLPYFIEHISLKGNRAFLKLEDVNTPEEAQRIARSAIFLPKTFRAKSGPGEFHDDEVIGFSVVDTTAGTLGKIVEIMRAGPNKLLAVDFEGRELLIPLNGPFIASVSKRNRKITVSLPEGFLDM